MLGRPANDFAYFDAPFTALAHRGGITEHAPIEVENSLRGFRAAWEFGFTHLETDVHTTADGVLVAFHDEVLDRVTDASGRLADLPWAEVQGARIGGSEPIPRLDDLLDALPAARFNIDLKSPSAVEPLAATIERHGAQERVCVGSFHVASITAFRKRTGGRVATAASPTEVAVFSLLPGVRSRWPLAGQAFQMPERHPRTGLRLLTRGMVDAAHRRGAVVHVWTINDRPTMERLIDLGVDGIVSDDLATLKAVLVERDLWEGHA
ncbi:MAG: glycerophosphodiester phosphodiesterase [Propionibacteriaceae bacterium]|nr:glycerophosphodiester phosphodiesterase [Propionibacteriaceae bacterium]